MIQAIGIFRRPAALALALAIAVLLMGAGPAAAKTGFGFNGTVKGFRTGEVFLTGGGSFDPATGFVKSAGGFRCIEAVEQGPLAGCQKGEGVRWDTAELLASTGFTCTGADDPKSAATGDQAVVLLADFYRAGDGVDESFTAKMIVSATDIADDIDGVQTLWIQGVGCGEAIANFAR